MNSLIRAIKYTQLHKETSPFCLHKKFYSTYYAESHEKIEVKNNVATLGISKYAQEIMGDIIFVDNSYEPEVSLEKGELICEIESVKACSEIYLPTSGKILEINENVLSEIDKDTDLWILKYEINDETELEVLLTNDAYLKYIEEIQ